MFLTLRCNCGVILGNHTVLNNVTEIATSFELLSISLPIEVLSVCILKLYNSNVLDLHRYVTFKTKNVVKPQSVDFCSCIGIQFFLDLSLLSITHFINIAQSNQQ